MEVQALISLLQIRAVIVFLVPLYRHKAVTDELGSRLLLSVCARCDLKRPARSGLWVCTSLVFWMIPGLYGN